jgi:hypothetical protein
MSLDGFVTDRNGDSSELYPDLESLRYSEALAEMIDATGAVVMGRRGPTTWATPTRVRRRVVRPERSEGNGD